MSNVIQLHKVTKIGEFQDSHGRRYKLSTANEAVLVQSVNSGQRLEVSGEALIDMLETVGALHVMGGYAGEPCGGPDAA